MRRTKMTISEAMNGMKEQMCVKKMCKRHKIPLYYVMGEKHRILLASFEFCQHMHKTGKLAKEPFPDGEILLQIKGDTKFWISTSRESLIALMENRKEPLCCVDLTNSNK